MCKARSQVDVQKKMSVWNKRNKWQVCEMNKKVKQKKLVNEVNKMIKWNNEINETSKLKMKWRSMNNIMQWC
jgi:hypothetical protein